MKYLIIGLGNYGAVLAEELSALGNEVIGVDSEEANVDRLKDKLATSFIIDATDAFALSALPLKSIDVAIVAVGENFGASVRIVSLLKKNKVAHIYARAVDEVHKEVLEAFSLDKILTPEKQAARMLVQTLEADSVADSFDIDEEYSIYKFPAPALLVGRKVHHLDWEKEYGLQLISIVRGRQVINDLGIAAIHLQREVTYPEDMEISENDQLVCIGRHREFMAFRKTFQG